MLAKLGVMTSGGDAGFTKVGFFGYSNQKLIDLASRFENIGASKTGRKSECVNIW